MFKSFLLVLLISFGLANCQTYSHTTKNTTESYASFSGEDKKKKKKRKSKRKSSKYAKKPYKKKKSKKKKKKNDAEVFSLYSDAGDVDKKLIRMGEKNRYGTSFE